MMAVHLDESTANFRRFLSTTHGEAYLAAKAQDFSGFFRGTLLIMAVFALISIAWDFAIDPVNAPHMTWVRCVQSVLLLLWALASWRDVGSSVARVLALLVPLVVEVAFIYILSVLQHEIAYAVGGFLYFFIFVPFLILAQPLLLSLLVLVLLAVTPPVAASLGLSAHLNWLAYAAYIGMVLGPMMLILLMFEYLYWTVFQDRQKIELLATTDHLTAVPNRRHFIVEATARLQMHQEHGGAASVLFVDIDRFKAINDRHGHAQGDQALIHVVGRLNGALRDRDLIGRYGGEEFVVFLSHTDAARAAQVAERMRCAVRAEPFRVDVNDPGVALTVSIGIATHTAGWPPDLDTLIAAADRSVYDAKRAGRDRVVASGTPLVPIVADRMRA